MAKFIKVLMFAGLAFVGMKFLGVGFPGNSEGGASLQALQDRAKAEGKDKIVVLLTGTSWCPYCKDLDREVISTPEWQSFIGSEAVFASYEYGPLNRPKSGPKGEMLMRFDIEGFPTMIVLNQNGKVLDEQAGYGSGGLGFYKDWIRSL